jgi:hypothetical protein
MNRKGKRSAAQMRAKTATRKTKPKAPRAAKPARAQSSSEKVRQHRKRMRAKGYRLVQMWLPDTRTAEFAREAHLQSLRAANSPTADVDQAWVDSVSWWNSEEAAALAESEPPVPWWREPEKPR